MQLAWIVALVGSIVSAIQTHEYPNYAWWALAYYLCVILGITVMVASDSVYTYHVAVCKLLSMQPLRLC